MKSRHAQADASSIKEKGNIRIIFMKLEGNGKAVKAKVLHEFGSVFGCQHFVFHKYNCTRTKEIKNYLHQLFSNENWSK
jgi:hypothetical protein